jgi:hypothetical protein
MAETHTITGNLRVRGNISADNIELPANAVGDLQANINDPLDVDKILHQYVPVSRQNHGAASVAKREVVHVANGAGFVREFRCGLTVANIGGATVTFDLLMNGVSILSAAKIINNGPAAYDVELGNLTTSPTCLR